MTALNSFVVMQVFSSTADMFLAPPLADSDGESDGSDRVPVPSFQNSFSQAFEQALSKLDHGNQTPAQALPIPGEKKIHMNVRVYPKMKIVFYLLSSCSKPV